MTSQITWRGLIVVFWRAYPFLINGSHPGCIHATTANTALLLVVIDEKYFYYQSMSLIRCFFLATRPFIRPSIHPSSHQNSHQTNHLISGTNNLLNENYQLNKDDDPLPVATPVRWRGLCKGDSHKGIHQCCSSSYGKLQRTYLWQYLNILFHLTVKPGQAYPLRFH